MRPPLPPAGPAEAPPARGCPGVLCLLGSLYPGTWPHHTTRAPPVATRSPRTQTAQHSAAHSLQHRRAVLPSRDSGGGSLCGTHRRCRPATPHRPHPPHPHPHPPRRHPQATQATCPPRLPHPRPSPSCARGARRLRPGSVSARARAKALPSRSSSWPPAAAAHKSSSPPTAHHPTPTHFFFFSSFLLFFSRSSRPLSRSFSAFFTLEQSSRQRTRQSGNRGSRTIPNPSRRLSSAICKLGRCSASLPSKFCSRTTATAAASLTSSPPCSACPQEGS